MAFVPEHRNQDATLYVGDLDPKVTESLLWELFLQAGPVSNVFIPKDKVSGEHQGFGFVEYFSESDADYASKIMNMIKLYNRPLRVNKASRDKKFFDVGANLFIGNLDPEVDEKLLYDTFSAFGVIVQTPKVVRGERCYGFISFDCFEASDAAIAAMNGQYLCNRPIHVSYAIKKDSVRGERHGDMAERALAASRPSGNASRPHTMFAAGLPAGMAAAALPPVPGAPAFPPSFPPSPFPSFPPGMPFPPQFMAMPPQFQQFPFPPPQQHPNSQPPNPQMQPPNPMSLPPGIRPPPVGFPGGPPPMGFPHFPPGAAPPAGFPPSAPPAPFPPGVVPPPPPIGR